MQRPLFALAVGPLPAMEAEAIQIDDSFRTASGRKFVSAPPGRTAMGSRVLLGAGRTQTLPIRDLLVEAFLAHDKRCKGGRVIKSRRRRSFT